MTSSVYIFIFGMWTMILIGGGIAVLVLGPITFSDFGEYSGIITSIVKGGIAVALAILWVLILAKVKNIIFKKRKPSDQIDKN